MLEHGFQVATCEQAIRVLGYAQSLSERIFSLAFPNIGSEFGWKCEVVAFRGRLCHNEGDRDGERVVAPFGASCRESGGRSE
ncbi:MAG: hypothetical protein IMHGJWDQ_000165 [Candidatus Fervidibacter sp.]